MPFLDTTVAITPPHGATPPWTLPDLDRQFELFSHDMQYGQRHSALTLKNRRVSYRNLREFLRVTRGETAPLGHPFVSVPAWLAWNGERRVPVSPVTLHSYFANLRAFARYLVALHGVADPFAGVRAPTLPARVPKARTPAECQRILDTAEHYPWGSAFERMRAVALVAIMLFAGLRQREVLTLKRNDVNLVEETILIKGKGRGGGKERVMFIAPDLHTALAHYIAVRDTRRDPAPEFFLALSNRGMSETTFRRTMRRIRAASGVPFTMHSLRHSFITQLLRSGVPIHVVSRAAGHTQITTTAGYLRVWDEDVRRAARTLTY
jgi:site-specific recombinase XerD